VELVVDFTLVISLLAVVAIVGVVTLEGTKRASWRAKFAPMTNDAAFNRLDERIARLEQALDVIAVEMERIGEGQRFLIRVLDDQRTPPS
jgi:hypothetical protein